MNRRLLALRLTGLGWYVATCILAGVFGGVALDKQFGLTPLFTVLGLLFGITAAFYGFYKMIQPLLRPEQSGKPPDDNSNGDGGDP